MFHCCKMAVCILAMLLPLPALADIIHWEVRNVDDPEVTGIMGRDFVLTGSFDYDNVTNSLFNITVHTSTTDGCVACNDFSDGGVGQTYLLPDGQGGVQFTEVYGPFGSTTGREYFLQISGENIYKNSTPFDVSQPGSFERLDIDHWGWVGLTDPLDPDMFESIGCVDCAYAVGTLVTAPVPEPETYALMLTGLGVLGWRVKRKTRALAFKP